MNDLERFIEKIEVGHPLACWEWTAHVSRNGYGAFYLHGRNIPAHRASLILLGSGVKDGLDVDHLCRNRSCVNPDHLEAVSRQENIRRGIAPDRRRRVRKKACKNGHPMTEANTYRRPNGAPTCRPCRKEASRRYEHSGRRSGSA